jgi:alpha-ketoglutarate-dependent 2,4-dichlorophenoxyacetate dioxygenase
VDTTTELRMSPLHPRFGVEIHDVDLREITSTNGYPALREAFEQHSLLLFREQQLDDRSHLSFGALWGPIENRAEDADDAKPLMANVSNRLDDDTIAAADDLRTLDLMANQLWHTDSTFLPVPALANILAARVLSSVGGETELVSTRAAWHDLPEVLKERIRGRVIRHRLAHSRAAFSAELVARHLARWPDQTWRAIWPNPVIGEESLYIASHSVAVEGMPLEEGQQLIADLIEYCTRPERVYTHRWLPGDVLVWDERATLHRGRPWPYHEERTLASICISATHADGVALVKPPAERA